MNALSLRLVYISVCVWCAFTLDEIYDSIIVLIILGVGGIPQGSVLGPSVVWCIHVCFLCSNVCIQCAGPTVWSSIKMESGWGVIYGMGSTEHDPLWAWHAIPPSCHSTHRRIINPLHHTSATGLFKSISTRLTETQEQLSLSNLHP